jgi:pentatricopeptide repeat protein
MKIVRYFVCKQEDSTVLNHAGELKKLVTPTFGDIFPYFLESLPPKQTDAPGAAGQQREQPMAFDKEHFDMFENEWPQLENNTSVLSGSSSDMDRDLSLGELGQLVDNGNLEIAIAAKKLNQGELKIGAEMAVKCALKIGNPTCLRIVAHAAGRRVLVAPMDGGLTAASVASFNDNECQRVVDELLLKNKKGGIEEKSDYRMAIVELKSGSTQRELMNCYKDGHMTDVINIYEHMGRSNLTKNNIVYGCTLKAYSRLDPHRSDHLNCLEAALCEMVHKEWYSGGRTEDDAYLSQLIDAHAVLGDPQGAEGALKRLQKEGLEPDRHSFTSLIKAYIKIGDAGGAQDAIKRMGEAGVQPDGNHYTNLAGVCAKNSDTKGAEDALRSMLEADLEPSKIIFGTLIDAYARSKDVCGAEDAMKRMQDAGLEPTEHCFAALIKAHARCGDIAGAEDVLTSMEKAGIQSSAHSFTPVMDAYAMRRDPQGTEAVFERMQKSCEPEVYSFTALSRAYARSKNPVGVEGVLTRMGEAGVQPNRYTFKYLIDAYGFRGDIQNAEDALWRMEQAGVRLNVYASNSLMDAYAKLGQPQGAEAVIERLLDAGLEPDVYSFNALSRAYARSKDPVGAEGVLTRMAEAGVQPDLYGFNHVIDAYASHGNIEGAEDAMRRMREAGLEPHEYTSKVLAKAHRGALHYESTELRVDKECVLAASRPHQGHIKDPYRPGAIPTAAMRAPAPATHAGRRGPCKFGHGCRRTDCYYMHDKKCVGCLNWFQTSFFQGQTPTCPDCSTSTEENWERGATVSAESSTAGESFVAKIFHFLQRKPAAERPWAGARQPSQQDSDRQDFSRHFDRWRK